MELKTYFAQDASGNIMPGATVTVYEAGTATLATGLQDESGSPLANPFTADSSAKVAFYAPDGLYDITVVGNGRTVTIRAQFVSVDGASVLRADLAATGGAALVGYGAGTVEDALDGLSGSSGGVIDIRAYGAVLDGVTNDAASLLAANAAAVAAKLPLLIPGVANIGAATTITVPLVDGIHQMFTATSSVTIDNKLPVRPEWWGNVRGNIRMAVAAIPAAGGVVQLRVARYKPSFDTALPVHFDNRGGTPNVDYLSRKNIRIQGAKLPQFSADSTNLVDGSGTIIEGTFYVASDSDGYSHDLVGFDGSPAVCAEYYGGNTLQDGFCVAQINKAIPVFAKEVHLGSSICTAGGHAMLFEAIDSGSFVYAEGRKGLYGVVIKSRRINGGIAVGRYCIQPDVYIKSENYAPMGNVSLASVISEGGASAVGPRVRISAETTNGGTVSIGNLVADTGTQGVHITATWPHVMDGVQIANIVTRAQTDGVLVDGYVRRCQLGKVSAATVTNAVRWLSTAPNSGELTTNSIGELLSYNATTALVLGSASIDAKLRVGNIAARNTTNTVTFGSSSSRLVVSGDVATDGSAIATASFAAGWANFGGGNGPDLSASVSGSRVSVSGLIKTTSGPGNQFGAITAQFAPEAPLRFSCIAFDGATITITEVSVGTDGKLYTSNVAGSSGATGYLSVEISWALKV